MGIRTSLQRTRLASLGLLAALLFLQICNVQLAQSQIVNTPKQIVADFQSAERTNAILIGWDGVQRNHLFELMSRGLLPNLNSLVQGGAIANLTVSDHATDTKSGWTQILTGYKWWRTWVYSNYLWFKKVPRGYTIPERLEHIFGADQIVTGFITGKLNQMEIVDGTGSAETGAFTHEAIYSNLPSQLDIVSVGEIDEDRYAAVVGPLTLQFIENNANNRFFAFFHFSDPDHIGHAYGENSAEYEQAIETCDLWLGQILNKLNTLNIDQKTLIYVTADHGFDEGGIWHNSAPYTFLATNDKTIVRNGDEIDVAPTVYYGLGIWNQSFSPALDGYPLQVDLPQWEEEHRLSVLSDNLPTPKPQLSVTEGADQISIIVTFNASTPHLAAVLLLVDDNLKADGPWTWNYNGDVNARGSFTIYTTNLTEGLHSVKILAFDEHATYTGYIGHDSEGKSPATGSTDFSITTTPSPVVPELPSPLIVLFLMVATLFVAAVMTPRHNGRGISVIIPSCWR